jgi:hypothetical protein
LWEKKSGTYESYEDFKNSWDPKTSIWKEIRNKTNRDVQADVEGILNIRSRKGIGHNINKRIEPIAIKPSLNREVNNLIENNKPFARYEKENGEVEYNRNHTKHKHTHSSSHKHTNSSSRNHSHTSNNYSQDRKKYNY